MTKCALVTGGSRGIGKATADALRALGWNVIMPTRAELDLSSLPSVDHFLVGVLSEKNKVDALIYCAGTWYSEILNDQWIGYYDEQYQLSVKSLWWIMAKMLQRGLIADSVLAVASTRGLIGGVDTGPYSCAKAAQIALMQGYAREYPGVRFNCICPGLTDTALGRRVIATGGAKPDAVPQSPESVAAVIVGLVTDGVSNGRVVQIVDSIATDYEWHPKGE